MKGALNFEHGPVVAFLRYCSCGKMKLKRIRRWKAGWEDPKDERIVVPYKSGDSERDGEMHCSQIS